MKVVNYQLGCRGVKIAVLADLHNAPWEKITAQTEALAPDLIVIPGDLTHGFDDHDQAAGFTAACSKIAPTYLSLGNHDTPQILQALHGTFLDNGFADIAVNGFALRIGGLSAPSSRSKASVRPKPDTAWLPQFCSTDRFKILLCHQPEHYPAYLGDWPIDLVISGHAHGGQWRIPFTNQGVFAPGQGLFPALTGGVINGRLVISRGVSNSVCFPRLFNPREIVIIEI